MNPDSIQQAYNAKLQLQQENVREQQRLAEEIQKFKAIIDAADMTTTAVIDNTTKTESSIKKGSDSVAKEVKSSADNVVATLKDTNTATRECLDKLIQVTIDSKDQELLSVVANFTTLLQGLNDAIGNIEKGPLNELPQVNKELGLVLEAINKELTEKEEPDYTECFKELEAAVKAIDVKPVVNVAKDPIDLSPLETLLTEVKDAIIASEIEVPETNMQPVIDGLMMVQDTIAGLKFPSPNYILPFKNTAGEAKQANLNSDGSIAISQAVLDERYDIQSPIIYIATAPVGTSNTTTGWTIIKYDITDLTNSSAKISTNVSWNNRATGTYA